MSKPLPSSLLLIALLFSISFNTLLGIPKNEPTKPYTSQTAVWLCSNPSEKDAKVSSDTVDPDGWRDIHWAVMCNTLTKKDKAVFKNHLDNQTLAGFTPLIVSIIHYNKAAFDLLIKWGADINIADKQGRTPLLHALLKGNESQVTTLLERGADPTLCDREGLSTLHYALLTGKMSLIKHFVKHVPAHQPSKDGRTPFHVAAQYGNAEAFNLLVDTFINNKNITFNCGISEENAPPTINPNGMCTADNLSCLQDVLQTSMKNGVTIAHYAATNNSTAILEQLASYMVSFNQPTKQGWLPIHYAAMYGATKSFIFLLNQNESVADVNTVRANHGWTPLHCAAFFGQTKLVSLLLGHLQDIDNKLLDGSTALHCAAMQDHVDIVKLLLEKGADASAQNEAGWTPLHMAAQYNNHEVIPLLLEYKSELAIQNTDGNTAYDIALINDASESKELLRTKTEVITLNENGHKHYTIRPALDIDLQRSELASPIAEGAIKNVRLLINEGESVDQSYGSIRLLDIPMYNEDEEMATVLFKHSVDAVSTAKVDAK